MKLAREEGAHSHLLRIFAEVEGAADIGEFAVDRLALGILIVIQNVCLSADKSEKEWDKRKNDQKWVDREDEKRCHRKSDDVPDEVIKSLHDLADALLRFVHRLDVFVVKLGRFVASKIDLGCLFVELAPQGVVDLLGVDARDGVPIIIGNNPDQYSRAADDEDVGEDRVDRPSHTLDAVNDQSDEVGVEQKLKRRVEEGHKVVDDKIRFRRPPHLREGEDVVIYIPPQREPLFLLFFLFLFQLRALFGADLFLCLDLLRRAVGEVFVIFFDCTHIASFRVP